MFEIRIELMSLLIKQPLILKSFEQKIVNGISNKYYYNGQLKGLGQVVADCLEVYFKIFSRLSDIVSTNMETADISSSELPSLNGLKNLLALQPSIEKGHYIKWIEASLNFDYSLIVADLVFENVLQLPHAEIVSLEFFIKKSITDFGAFSTLTNFWHPEVDDEIQLIRNIKIKAAALEVENGKSIFFSKEELCHLMAS